jgi:hypothetical protein
MPDLSPVGAVKVETKNEKGKSGPARKGKLLPTGPELRDGAYVEFDLARFPIGCPGENWNVSFNIFASGGNGHNDYPQVMVSLTVEASNPLACGPQVLQSLLRFSCKAELIGQTKLRVYGQVVSGRYNPVHRGAVESEDLPPHQLPKVKNAGS